MRSYLFLSLILIPLLSGCILPPDADEGRQGTTFLESQELSLVTHLKRGSDFALAGRADLAEAEYRWAIKIRPDLATPLSDLGFVLLQQERDAEAARILTRAIELQPNHVVAHENLGRALYRLGDSAGAAEHFETAITILAAHSPEEIREITGRRFDQTEIGAIHRSLSIAYLANGNLDEAVCNSKAALTIANNLDEAGTHGRLLLALGMIDAATKLYADTITVWQTQVPPKMFFDYGLTLYSRGQYDLAKDNFAKVLESRNTQREDRNVTHIMRLLIARKEGNTVEEQSIADGLNDESSELCKRFQVDANRYWPYQVVEDVGAYKKELCPAEELAAAQKLLAPPQDDIEIQEDREERAGFVVESDAQVQAHNQKRASSQRQAASQQAVPKQPTVIRKPQATPTPRAPEVVKATTTVDPRPKTAIETRSNTTISNAPTSNAEVQTQSAAAAESGWEPEEDEVPVTIVPVTESSRSASKKAPSANSLAKSSSAKSASTTVVQSSSATKRKSSKKGAEPAATKSTGKSHKATATKTPKQKPTKQKPTKQKH